MNTKKPITIILFLIAYFAAVNPLHAAIVTHEHGGKEKGRIGEIIGSEFQFFTDRFYIVDARRITSVDVDETLSGDALQDDRERVARLRLLIDKRNIVVDRMQQQVRQWLRDREYDKLEQKSTLLMLNRSRWGDGSWAIDDFYRAMTEDLPNRSISKYNARLAEVEAWVAARPDSVTARLGLVQVLIDKAWAHRGGGYSRTVTEENWQKFEELLQRAARLAEEVAAAGADDPVIYDLSIRLLNPLGADKNDLKNLALQSLEAHPGFYPVYSTTYHALLPKWSGRRGEVQEFIDKISHRIRKTHPEAIYLAHRRLYKNFEPREYAQMNFNWRSILYGFERFRQQYHADDADFHLMAMLACLHGDKTRALEFFAATSGTWNYLSERIWRKPDKLESYRAWAARKDPPYYKTIKKALLENDVPVLTKLVKTNPALLDIFLHKDLYGDTMLHELVSRNDREMLSLLAELGVSLESRNDSGYTPLQWAAYLGREESLATLIAHGADLFSGRGKKGDQPAHIAAKNGFESVLAMLARHDPKTIVSPNNNQTRPIHYAAWNGHLDSVSFILQSAPKEIDQQDKYLYTPLHYAIDRGYIKIVNLLIDSSADTSLKNKKGYTPLSFARNKGFAEIENLLKNLGAEDSVVVDNSAKMKLASEIYKQGSQYFNQQDYRKAVEIYHKSLEAYPDYYLAYAALAQVAFDFEKDFVKADEYYDKSIELNPDYAENYYWKARTNYNLNRPEVYRPLFRKYVEMAPDSYNAIDLKNNWSQLLVDEQATATSPAEPESSPYLLPAIAALGLFLGLLLLLRMRRSS